MKKKLLIIISVIAIFFSAKASVDPFYLKGHGAAKLADNKEHFLTYFVVEIPQPGYHTISIENLSGDNYIFSGKKSEVYEFVYYLQKYFGMLSGDITVTSEDSCYGLKPKKYSGSFTKEGFVAKLDALDTFLGIDVE